MITSIDYELVKKKDYYNIWKKYEGLMMIYFKKLPEEVKNYMFEDFADFKSSCYPVIVSAVDSIHLNKIKNKDTWTAWQQLSFYLQNYTTRQCCRDTYKEFSGSPIMLGDFDSKSKSSSERDALLAVEDHKEYNMLMNSFSKEEKEIVEQRLSGVAWYKLQKAYGVDYVNELRSSIEDKITKYL